MGSSKDRRGGISSSTSTTHARRFRCQTSRGRLEICIKKVKEITGKFTYRIIGLKDGNGKTFSIVQKYKKDGGSTQNICTRKITELQSFVRKEFEQAPSITVKEMRKALHALRGNKAPGDDGIPSELLNASGEEGTRALTILCQRIWEAGM